jgi:hypothetical protein
MRHTQTRFIYIRNLLKEQLPYYSVNERIGIFMVIYSKRKPTAIQTKIFNFFVFPAIIEVYCNRILREDCAKKKYLFIYFTQL